jgi:hypothetical protein
VRKLYFTEINIGMPPKRYHVQVNTSSDILSVNFTEINIGMPPKHYHVQVNTSSDILSVNFVSSEKCPHNSGLGVTIFHFSFLYLNCVHFDVECGVGVSV